MSKMIFIMSVCMIFLSCAKNGVDVDQIHKNNNIDTIITNMGLIEKIDQLLIPFAYETNKSFGGLVFMKDNFIASNVETIINHYENMETRP